MSAIRMLVVDDHTLFRTGLVRLLGDYPTLGRKAAAAIPGAKLVEIEGVGHLPQVEAFERYRSALLDFIR